MLATCLQLCLAVVGASVLAVLAQSISELVSLGLHTLQELVKEGRIVYLASIDCLKHYSWPLTILICAIVLVPLLVKAALGLWCLQSWKSQQQQMHDRVADEVKNVEQTRALMSSAYQGQIRYVEDQKQKHILDKISEVRRIREKHEARRTAIEEECNVFRVQQQLASNLEMTPLQPFHLPLRTAAIGFNLESRLRVCAARSANCTSEFAHGQYNANNPWQAFSLGMECERLKATKEQRLAHEDEVLWTEIEDAEEGCKRLHENVDISFAHFEHEQLQQRAQTNKRLLVLQDELTKLRNQYLGHFGVIVGERLRSCDQALKDIQLTLTAGT